MKFDRFNQQLGESFKRELTIMETMPHYRIRGPTQASESLDYSSVVEISLRGCAQILPAKLVPSHYLAIAEESYVPFQQSMQINRMAAVANREEDGESEWEDDDSEEDADSEDHGDSEEDATVGEMGRHGETLPSSPGYSPTSPVYSPTSPAYPPTSPGSDRGLISPPLNPRGLPMNMDLSEEYFFKPFFFKLRQASSKLLSDSKVLDDKQLTNMEKNLSNVGIGMRNAVKQLEMTRKKIKDEMFLRECGEAVEQSHPDYVCPISHCFMRDPVIASDGHSYDRDAITNFIDLKISRGDGPAQSPLTRVPLRNYLYENITLKKAIRTAIDGEMKKRRPAAAPQTSDPDEKKSKRQRSEDDDA